MLDAILKMVSPEELFSAIKRNPTVIQIALQKFEAYRALGTALTDGQQLCISNNLHLLAKFFSTKQGKEYISIMAEDFEDFVKRK